MKTMRVKIRNKPLNANDPDKISFPRTKIIKVLNFQKITEPKISNVILNIISRANNNPEIITLKFLDRITKEEYLTRTLHRNIEKNQISLAMRINMILRLICIIFSYSAPLKKKMKKFFTKIIFNLNRVVSHKCS